MNFIRLNHDIIPNQAAVEKEQVVQHVITNLCMGRQADQFPCKHRVV